MKKLNLSSDLALPLDAATQTFAFIGRKGSGKSYGAGKMVELLIGAAVQVAILDTVGNWYGLRLTADGKREGIYIPILGGLRGDIPLEPTAGALVADVLVDSGRSLIIDASQFSKADRQRFAKAFGEQLWKRKKAEHNPHPIHLVLEESQLIVPEKVHGDAAGMVGIYEEIIRLGRNYGIGVSMITQRPQSVNKEVLNQTECLMAFQVNGAHERKALRDWIVHQGMDVNLLNELPSLKPGHCYVWSPQWLGILEKIVISKKETFDSTSTPKTGGTWRGKKLAPIDLDVLKDKMAATIERAKQEDPRELKKKIAELEKKLGKGTHPVANVNDKDMQKLLATIEDQARAIQEYQANERTYKLLVEETAKENIALHGMAQKLQGLANRSTADMKTLWNLAEQLGKALPSGKVKIQFPRTVKVKVNSLPIKISPELAKTFEYQQKVDSHIDQHDRKVMRDSVRQSMPVESLGKCAEMILRFLASQPERSFTKIQVAVFTLYNHSGGNFNNSIYKCTSAGLIHKDGNNLQIAKGFLLDTLPTKDLPVFTDWYGKLGKASREILRTLLEAPGYEMEKEEIASKTNYASDGGNFMNSIYDLTGHAIVIKEGSLLKINPEIIELL